MNILLGKKVNLIFTNLKVLVFCLAVLLYFPPTIKAEVCLINGGLVDCGQSSSCNCHPNQFGAAICECSGSNYNCNYPANCASNETPDWSSPGGGCVPWDSNGGGVCGNAIRKGGNTDCGYLCGCPGEDCGRPCKFLSVQYADCVPNCNTTAPTNITVTPLTISSATINWTLGSNGTKQILYVGADPTLVSNNCVGASSPQCVVNEQNLSASATSYSTGSVLVPGTVYYAKVVTYKDSGCSTGSTSKTFVSSCTMSPSSLTIEVAKDYNLVSGMNSSSAVSSVNFSSQDSDIASVSPTSDTGYVYQTTLDAQSVGTTVVTSNVIIDGQVACTGTTNVTVIPPHPWWQVMDGDVTARGNLLSHVAEGNFFNLQGAGGFPGVSVYNGTFSTDSGENSVTNWSANSQVLPTKVFDFSYFERLMPDSVSVNQITSTNIAGTDLESGGVPYQGYYWYLFDGTTGSTLGSDLTITGNVDLGDRKVILLVKGADLNINGNINLDDGQGFFLTAVNGNIDVDPNVSFVDAVNLEGLYLSDGSFNSGSLGEDLDSPLYLRGSLASYGGVNFARDLVDDTNTPGEFIEYAPDQILLFPSALGYRKINWKEVNP